MARKRAYGTGTPWQDKRTGRWRGQIRLDGRRHSVAGATRAEVVAKLGDLRDRHEAGEAVEATEDMPTLGAWLDRWQNEFAEVGAEGTDDNRAWAVGHLRPLHGIALDEVTVGDIEALLSRKAARLGQSSLVRLRSALRQALHEAERRRVIDWNAAGSDAGKPRVHIPRTAKAKRERRALTGDQARTLLEVAHGDRAELLVILGLYLGLRPGEITGLRWCDVDLEAGTLEVAQMRRRNPDGSMTFVDPKAKSGRVIEDLPEAVTDALRRHEVRQRKARMSGKAAWSSNDLVMTTRTGGPLDASNHRREVARLAKAAGIFMRPALTPNELRHSAASLWADAGISVPRISHLLGHKDLRMATQNYAAHKVAPTAAPDVFGA